MVTITITINYYYKPFNSNSIIHIIWWWIIGYPNIFVITCDGIRWLPARVIFHIEQPVIEFVDLTSKNMTFFSIAMLN